MSIIKIYYTPSDSAGQIRDFSLFNHFVKPMSAGVTVTCVMDCCHSGSVLDLPYSFRPTPGGEIRMRQSMDHLENLAFLFMMAGGVLPHGFDNIASNLGAAVGDMSEVLGVGLAHLMQDGVAPEDVLAPLYHAFEGGIPVMDGLNIDRESLPVLEGVDLPDFGMPDMDNIPDFEMPSEGIGDFARNATDPAADNCDGCGAIGEAPEELDCGCVADIVSSLFEAGARNLNLPQTAERKMERKEFHISSRSDEH